jgi:VIT1/CCC1 family predicted Fe2+/Mn2+ transporter
MSGEIKLEKGHIANYHKEEMQELSNLLALIGIPASSSNLNGIVDSANESQSSEEEIRELRRLIKKHYDTNTDALLKIMVALELGVIDGEVRSPFVAGGTSFVCFFVGALPSTVPFALVADSKMGLLIAGIATGSGLLIVGAIKSWATRGNFVTSAIENLSITVVGGAIAYGIGVGFQNLMGDGGA